MFRDLRSSWTIPGLNFGYPTRWIAIKLLEGDTEVQNIVSGKAEAIVTNAAVLAGKIEENYKARAYVTIASERYAITARVTAEAQQQKSVRLSFSDYLDKIATHKVGGYIIAFIVIAGLLLWTFGVGSSLSRLLTMAFSFFQRVDPSVSGTLWSVSMERLIRRSHRRGYSRYTVCCTVLLDARRPGRLRDIDASCFYAGHRHAPHGLAWESDHPNHFGLRLQCSRHLLDQDYGTRRERLLAAFAITFSPCAARTVIILGLVGAFIGIPWAIALYVVDIAIMFAAVKLLGTAMPGKLSGLNHGDALF